MTRTLLRACVLAAWIIASLPFCLAGRAAASQATPAPGDGGADAVQALGDYVLIGWNDLGMHCSNKNFADLAVLPPYNTVWATLIRRGNTTTLPPVVNTGYSVTYGFEANTYSVGKTDFWSYEDLLFGVNLPDNIGLTGKGLTGTLDWSDRPLRSAWAFR